MSVFYRSININCMPSCRPHHFHHFRPMMPMCMPYYNSVFYGMGMLALGQATGNALLSMMGLGNNNNVVYQQPVYAQPMPVYQYPQPVYQPVMNYQGYPAGVDLTNPLAMAGMVPAKVTTTTIATPAAPAVTSGLNTGYHRTEAKVKKIDWSKLNPFQKKKVKVSDKNKLPELNQVGYNQKKGMELAQDALSHANSKSTGFCARSVKESIARTGLGDYESGHAYQCADILSRNPNFKEVKVAAKDVDKLPAGCVIVYPQGDSGYSDQYGHVEISLGNGKAASDFVNRNVKDSANARVFVPVAA